MSATKRARHAPVSSPHVHANPPTKWWLVIIGVIIGLVLTPIIGLLIPFIYDFGAFRGFCLTWLALAALTTTQLVMMRRTGEKQVLRDWQKNVRIIKSVGVPRELVCRLAYKLDEKNGPNNTIVHEDIIENATRKHKVQLWRHLSLPVGIFVIRFVELALLTDITLPIATVTYARIFIITMLLNAFWILIVVQEWRHEVLIITNFNVREIKYRPPWLWFIPPNDDTLPIARILDIKQRQTRLGMMFDYGVVSLGTAMTDTEDKPYRKINFIPKAEEVSRAITLRMQ